MWNTNKDDLEESDKKIIEEKADTEKISISSRMLDLGINVI